MGGLERDELSRGGRPSLNASLLDPSGLDSEGLAAASESSRQVGLFQAPAAEDPLVGRLKTIHVDNLTPLQALSLLAELKREAGG